MNLSERSSESESRAAEAICTEESAGISCSGNSMTGKGWNEAEDGDEDDDDDEEDEEERRGRWPRALRIWKKI